MNLRYGECVLAVLRGGSITAAAKSLYLSQSALSQTIKRAEEELGAPIFNRDTDPISLTYAGERYLKAVGQVMAINTNLNNEISEINREVQGRLRLGISLQRGMALLPLVIPEFVQRYPHVKIDLTERGSDTLEKLLHEGICDLALITTDPKFSDLEYILLEAEEVVLIAALDTPLARAYPDGAEIPIEAAVRERFVSLRHGHSVRKAQDELFQSHHINPQMLLETDSLEAAKRLAASGSAVMLCPYVYVRQSPEVRAKVKCLRVQGVDFKRHFYLSYRKGLFFTRFMTDFMQIVKAKLQAAQEEGS
ncbi:MAG: LysR family transcriptional regulator [Christensenellales bacterium]